MRKHKKMICILGMVLLMACLIFTLTAPKYIWTIIGI